MGANRLIFFLCLYRTVPCMDVAKNNGNDGEAASENRTNVGNHDNKERNTDDWDIGLKYLDSLVQKTIDNVSAISDVRGQEQRQQYIADLRDKYEQFRNVLKAQAINGGNLMTLFQRHQYEDRNVTCGEQNCFSNDSRGKERPEERRFNRTIAWFRHTALRRLLLNAATKCIFNGTEIPINVERRANDLYLWAVIPQQVLPIKSCQDVICPSVTASRNYKTEREKLEDCSKWMTATQVSPIALSNVAKIPAWWNGVWFWTIHLIALILLLIFALSCCIWHCGSNNKRPNYIRI
ncbi:hypothetical protein ACH3XW_34830 [Acanthocheilonema viteae]